MIASDIKVSRLERICAANGIEANCGMSVPEIGAAFIDDAAALACALAAG